MTAASSRVAPVRRIMVLVVASRPGSGEQFRGARDDASGTQSRTGMKILGKQLSGLGNQLFQYAAGLYFADRYDGRLIVLQEPQQGTISHGQYSRPFLLPRFAIQAPIRLRNRFDHQMFLAAPRFPAARRALQRLAGITVREESLAQRYHFVEDLRLPPRTNTLYVAGYWQAYQYAEAVAPKLRVQLRLREPAAEGNLRSLERIRGARTAISVHLRRGDYTLAAEGNIALPLSYYERALRFMRERFEEPTFFVFSDDLAFARRHLPTTQNFVFVEGNDDFSSQEDLRLMAACQHHIIANSSFSWWGAWLNPDADKVVVAPRHWLLSPESAFPDLLPPQWHALDSLREPASD